MPDYSEAIANIDKSILDLSIQIAGGAAGITRVDIGGNVIECKTPEETMARLRALRKSLAADSAGVNDRRAKVGSYRRR